MNSSPADLAERDGDGRRIRLFELALVCLVAFGSLNLASIRSLMFGLPDSSPQGGFEWMESGLHEATCLGLLWYVLMRGKRSFQSLGLTWHGIDLGHSVLLCAGGWLAFNGAYYTIYYSGLVPAELYMSGSSINHTLFGGGISWIMILFLFLNPFFEELIVRAYVITEIKALTGSMVAAVLISTLLQTSYHFYQGVPIALADGAMFFLWSIYYAETNRIAPVILAHFYNDIGATLWYFWSHPRSVG